jgi:hypothetical protein
MNVFEHAHFQCKDMSVLSAVGVRALLPVKKSILFSYFYFCCCQDFISCIGVPENYIDNADSVSHSKGYKAVYLYKKKNKWYISKLTVKLLL